MVSIVAFYHFLTLDDIEDWRARFTAKANELGVIGTVLLATEGINGTVSSSRESLDALLAWLRSHPGLENMEAKFAEAEKVPFARLYVRLKKEIVALGEPVDPNTLVGTYVEPEDWDELIAKDDVMLIDCRNSYEVQVGSFEGAIDPETDSFRQFPKYARSLDPKKNPKVAMFCTGGIRCEKATSLMLELGFEEVYHLKGGILRYLETEGDRGAWNGDCFVFDRRVSVTPGLEPGEWELCWGCRLPLRDEDRDPAVFEMGVACGRCHERFTEEDKKNKRERHRQIMLAAQREQAQQKNP